MEPLSTESYKPARETNFVHDTTGTSKLNPNDQARDGRQDMGLGLENGAVFCFEVPRRQTSLHAFNQTISRTLLCSSLSHDGAMQDQLVQDISAIPPLHIERLPR